MPYSDMITLALLSQDDSSDADAGFETNFSTDTTIGSDDIDAQPSDDDNTSEAVADDTDPDGEEDSDKPDLADNPMNDESIAPEDRPRPEVGELSVDKVAEQSEVLRQKDEIKQSKEAP